MYMKKHHMKSKQTKFWKRAHALFVICTRGTTLPQCYMRAHSFSANQERVIFFLPIIMQPIIYSKVSLPYKQSPIQNDIHIVGGFRVTVRKSTP